MAETPQPEQSPLTPPDGISLLHTLSSHSRLAAFLAWSPDGALLASAGFDHIVYLWNPCDGSLLHSLSAHTGNVTSLAWSPDGALLASGAVDNTVRLWNPGDGSLLGTLSARTGNVTSLAWSPDGALLASGASLGTVHLWSPRDGSLLHSLSAHTNWIESLTWSPDGTLLASGAAEGTVHLWNPRNGSLLHSLSAQDGKVLSLAWSPDGALLASDVGHGIIHLWNPRNGFLLHSLSAHSRLVKSLAWSPNGALLASGAARGIIHLWNPRNGSLLHSLLAHTKEVSSLTWSPDGTLLASSSSSYSPSFNVEVRIWRAATWEPLALLTGLKGLGNIAWHPRLALLATDGQRKEDIIIWQLDLARLLGTAPSVETVHYTNAKAVLVGDSGVGKSGLALVLTNQRFVATESTHGRHIWSLDQYEVQEGDQPREKREVLLWDLAGQQDYRLIHQLHLHEATVALIVFDAARNTDPFAGVQHWQRALRQAQQARGSSALPLTIFLVAARSDRGGSSVSRERVHALARALGCAGYIETSAKLGQGIDELKEAIRTAIDWERLPKVTSTQLLYAMKEFMLVEQQAGRLLRSIDDLYVAFLHTDDAPPSDAALRLQFEAALGRMEAQGYIRMLGFGDLVLLQPELLDAYASALLIAVKKEPDGLGSIAEASVQRGEFEVPAEDRLLNRNQEKLLLIAMIDELVSNQLALRESGFLLFPSQSTREHPERGELEGRQTVTFTFAGLVLSVYTTLVVRLAQSGIFDKQNLWQNVVTYTTRLGGTYGLLLIERGEERGELGLFFDEVAREEMRFYFEDFVQRHLERLAGRGSVQRRRRFVCPGCGEIFSEVQISRRRERGFPFIMCSTCDTKVSLLEGEERLSNSLATGEVKKMEQAADEQRDRESAKSILQGKIATQDFDVFLCHKGGDKPEVKQIGNMLKELGVLPWLDEWELRPGMPWQRALEQQIEKIKAAAVFVGKDGLGPWQRQELDAFLREFVDRGCPVIPVLLPDAPQKPDLPVFLRGMTWVDFRVKEPDPMERLVWGITGRRALSF